MELAKSLALIPKYQAVSSWWEHVPIAHWIVEKLKPDTIVELGSHYGVSFFSFCEAAEHYSPNSYIYAIDTWEGDDQAGYYKNSVYEQVSSHWEQYHSQRSALIRSRFEEAVDHFKDKSIDIIHIDGLHTYDAVKNDFETWKAKLKNDGTIIFHDWNVRKEGFGVWKLWEEIKESGEFRCMQTPNGYGLGIATKAHMKPEWHNELEHILPTLVAKGRLLEQIQKEKQVNEIRTEEWEIQKEHSKNLEVIRAENEKYINSLKEELVQTQQELSDSKGELRYWKKEAKISLIHQIKTLLKRVIKRREYKTD